MHYRKYYLFICCLCLLHYLCSVSNIKQPISTRENSYTGQPTDTDGKHGYFRFPVVVFVDC